MTRADSPEIGLYHGFLNSLYAYLQGYYARLNLQKQLGASRIDESYIGDTTKALDALGELYRGLWDGKVYDLTDPSPPSEVHILFSIYDAALYSYERAPEHLAYLITAVPGDYDRRDAVELCSFLAEQAYARDHFIKGLIAYGEHFKIEEVADRWRQQMFSVQNEIRDVMTYFNLLKDETRDLHEIMPLLQDEAWLLPGILMTKAVDLRHLNSKRVDSFGFEDLDIPVDEVQEWESHGFSPLGAGYWRAFGFTPVLALTWLEAGFSEPGHAGNYYLRGIDLVEASQWASRGIAGSDAAKLMRTGVSPENYEDFVKDAH